MTFIFAAVDGDRSVGMEIPTAMTLDNFTLDAVEQMCQMFHMMMSRSKRTNTFQATPPLLKQMVDECPTHEQMMAQLSKPQVEVK